MAPESLSQLLVDVRGGVYSDLDAGRGPRSDPEATLGFQIIPARTRGDYPSEVVYNQRELPMCGDKPSESRGSKMRRALLSNSTWCVLLTGIVDWPPASLAARGPRILVRIFGRPIHAPDMRLLGGQAPCRALPLRPPRCVPERRAEGRRWEKGPAAWVASHSTTGCGLRNAVSRTRYSALEAPCTRERISKAGFQPHARAERPVVTKRAVT